MVEINFKNFNRKKTLKLGAFGLIALLLLFWIVFSFFLGSRVPTGEREWVLDTTNMSLEDLDNVMGISLSADGFTPNTVSVGSEPLFLNITNGIDSERGIMIESMVEEGKFRLIELRVIGAGESIGFPLLRTDESGADEILVVCYLNCSEENKLLVISEE